MLHTFKTLARDHPVMRALLLRALAQVRRLAHAPPGLYTLCYHRVPEGHRAGFAAQIAALRRHGRFVGADEAVTLLKAGEAGTARHFLVTFDDGYADTVEVALPVLREAGVPAILFLVSDWLDAPPQSPPGPYADRAMVKDWLAAGMEVGSHGVSHARIAMLGDAAARREIASSRTALEAATGRPVRHFACPWGVAGRDYRPERDPALALASGYASFFTTRRGVATGTQDLAALPRHVLEPEWPLHELDALMGARLA
ncbi:polysaccharide deacetylase family protein [Methylobacterium nonmethylotrophicum]|uniref:Chitooligosaccharide deacetylase n=1 Tax=Methylobacterium nonmethylotrophicum TaxID=1141884 RepID=A0A4Z0NHT9_9HYPH|nr:polysaccharide deacetylase family protein [Methylobacterium nonmethylotrophicum]TGD95678.1 polysaccharide deacetylase family protein [Methylobacterium nonmethylotrophicum]